MDLSWDGPNPNDRAVCPYPVNFYCTPSPAESLNSLESGRLLIQVDLGTDVRSVAGRLVNSAKSKNLDKLDEDASTIKRKTTISAAFSQDKRNPSRWVGELSIPASWIEGGTRTHERTGAASPKSPSNLYTLEITYTLENSNNSCTARFSSEDAFHWHTGSN